MNHTPSHDLFGEIARLEPRRQGILPSQDIRELIRNGKIRSSTNVPDEQIQPASIDLRLGNVAYHVKASIVPSLSATTIGTKIRELTLAELDLTKPTTLKAGEVFIVPLIESLALPKDISGKANPKSTTGRLDVFTRLMADRSAAFESVPQGYMGDLFVEIFPRTFSIVVQTGTSLNQLRFIRGNASADDEQLRKLAQKRPLVYHDNGVGPTRPSIREGLRVCIDLKGHSPQDIVAYKAKKKTSPIDLSRKGVCDPQEFWEAIRSRNNLVLNPGDFYLLASKERVSVPGDYAAEMEPYDPTIGEFTVHYAGFFDPGFGYGVDGEVKGTKAVLEVRAHEVPILLEDGQEVCRLTYYHMADLPDKVYGQAIGSSYQQQGLALSKQFKTAAPAAAPANAATQR